MFLGRYHFVGVAILFVVGLILLALGICLWVGGVINDGWTYGLVIAGAVLMGLALLWLLLKVDNYHPQLEKLMCGMNKLQTGYHFDVRCDDQRCGEERSGMLGSIPRM